MQAAVILAVPRVCCAHDVLGVEQLLRQLGAMPVSGAMPVMKKYNRGEECCSLQYSAGRETTGMGIVSNKPSAAWEF